MTMLGRLPTLLCLLALPLAAIGQTTEPQGDQEQLVLATLQRQLTDPERTAQTKLEAATLLVGRKSAEADRILRDFLSDKLNPSARVAVAQALAASGPGRVEFVDPLFAMLAEAEPAVRDAAAAALGSYGIEDVLARLVKLAGDSEAGEPTRLGSIQALSRVPGKRSVAALIAVLKARQPNLRAAACEALARQTGIQGFGADADRWQAWWQENKDKSPQQWLADLADGLVRRNLALEGQNAALRSRLVAALGELYNVAAATDRPALILTFLKDPLADARLVGLQLGARLASADPPAAAKMAPLVRALLNDKEPPVRSAAAMLVPSMNDPEGPPALLRQLEREPVDAVRESLVTALGALRVPEAMPAFLKALADEPDGTAAAAAAAIERMVEKAPLPEAAAKDASRVLIARFGRSGLVAGAPQTRSVVAADPKPALREALLGAMAALGRPESAEVMRSALADEVARVRLAAVRGLQKLNDSAGAAAIAPLVADADRGVRQAAIAALGALGAVDQLETVMGRTPASAETDPAVRQQAWDTALALLAKAPLERVAATVQLLADRDDARECRIKLLSLWRDRLDEKPAEQLEVRTRLADALLAAGRPAEAAVEFRQAMLAANGDSTKAGELFLRWIKALLAADDAAAVPPIAAQTDAKLFPAARGLLEERIAALMAEGKYDTVIRLCEPALAQLKDKLTPDEARAIQTDLDDARARQSKADHDRVAQLVQQASTGDEAGRKTATAALEGMGKRAVGPIVEQLREVVVKQPPSPELETVIVAVLTRLAPDLTGYDPQAKPADKLKVIDLWLKRLGNGAGG